MSEKRYLDIERMQKEGLATDEGFSETAEKLIETIVRMTLDSDYGFMLGQVQEAMGGDRRKLSAVHDRLYSLGIIRLVPGQTGPGRAGSAMIRLNYSSPFWTLKPEDAIAFLSEMPSELILEEDCLAVHLCMVRDDCLPGEESEKLDVFLERVRRGFSFEEEEIPFALIKEICFFIRKKSVYDPERRGGEVAYDEIRDPFAKWGFDPAYIARTIEDMTEGGLLQKVGDRGRLFFAYQSANDIVWGF